ncbi:alternative ribosome rescue aminoacyl-tRNA hydrolase ArfB [Aquimarina spongiae]|uniref:Ribosome-associated protein n=1 Tax=Aquimarina spongiae TaxID=570521 RepID=A0A1M6IE76_9FLAO|nr:alternative ribosome rescue aminoacyl-tRNA hydrolase ArfB [Aquimarina spongiae]SHJ32729.1 ribosome-associated protein [Aquimarina spongiae]
MNIAVIISELNFKAVRSSGAGGQHVNKVSSKIALSFDIKASSGLTDAEKVMLQHKLSSRLTKTGHLILFCSDSRSQHRNKELAIKRLVELLKTHSKVPQKRKLTKPSKSSVKKRLDAKHKQSLKKTNRKKPLF